MTTEEFLSSGFVGKLLSDGYDVQVWDIENDNSNAYTFRAVITNQNERDNRLKFSTTIYAEKDATYEDITSCFLTGNKNLIADQKENKCQAKLLADEEYIKTVKNTKCRVVFSSESDRNYVHECSEEDLKSEIGVAVQDYADIANNALLPYVNNTLESKYAQETATLGTFTFERNVERPVSEQSNGSEEQKPEKETVTMEVHGLTFENGEAEIVVCEGSPLNGIGDTAGIGHSMKAFETHPIIFNNLSKEYGFRFGNGRFENLSQINFTDKETAEIAKNLPEMLNTRHKTIDYSKEEVQQLRLVNETLTDASQYALLTAMESIGWTLDMDKSTDNHLLFTKGIGEGQEAQTFDDDLYWDKVRGYLKTSVNQSSDRLKKVDRAMTPFKEPITTVKDDPNEPKLAPLKEIEGMGLYDSNQKFKDINNHFKEKVKLQVNVTVKVGNEEFHAQVVLGEKKGDLVGLLEGQIPDDIYARLQDHLFISETERQADGQSPEYKDYVRNWATSAREELNVNGTIEHEPCMTAKEFKEANHSTLEQLSHMQVKSQQVHDEQLKNEPKKVQTQEVNIVA